MIWTVLPADGWAAALPRARAAWRRRSPTPRLLRLTRPRAPWIALAAVVVLLLPARARAQQMVLEFDPARTQVRFTLDAFLHTVHGTMQMNQGKIEVDPTTGQATGRVVVDARSADTGNDGRDIKMHKDILESQEYPDITFTPVRVEGQFAPEGKSQLRLHGNIGLHGSEQEITMKVDVEIAGSEWSAETTFAVPYGKWGLKNPSTFFLPVKDTVNVTIHAAGSARLDARRISLSPRPGWQYARIGFNAS
jgi:polyisoprenoid-binding protein YceI